MNRALIGFAVLLSGCASIREAAPFSAVASDSASVRWQQGSRVYLRIATFEKSGTGAVRATIGRNSGGRQFLLEPDGMVFTQGWTGQAGAAPPGVSVWSSLLTIYQNADRLPVGERELHTPGARIAVLKTTRGLETVGIRSLDTAESLSVVFKPAR